MLSQYLGELLELVLRNKFVYFSGKIFLKKQSLSIGETIATSAATIYRHFFTDSRFYNVWPEIRLFKGYVDDLMGLFVGTARRFKQFQEDLNQQDHTIKVKWSKSFTSVDYLDLNISISGKCFVTSTYSKPKFAPQYIPSVSCHRDSAKWGAAKSECNRYLMNSSDGADFQPRRSLLIDSLVKRGFSRPSVESAALPNTWDNTVRENKLFEISIRAKGPRSKTFTSAVLVLRHDKLTPGLRLSKHLKNLSDRLGMAPFKIGWKNSANLFLLDYRQNFPRL